MIFLEGPACILKIRWVGICRRCNWDEFNECRRSDAFSQSSHDLAFSTPCRSPVCLLISRHVFSSTWSNLVVKGRPREKFNHSCTTVYTFARENGQETKSLTKSHSLYRASSVLSFCPMRLRVTCTGSGSSQRPRLAS